MGSREFQSWKAYYGMDARVSAEDRSAVGDALALLDAQGGRR